jgi:ubiquinol-cytochrome c reductase cytochrome c1 subunit
MMRFALPLGLIAGLLVTAPAFAADTTRLPVKKVDFSFDGPFGTYDRGALQRGFQVYKEVCATCHGLDHIAFHDLDEEGGPGFSEAQAKAIAAGYKIPAEPNDKGELFDDKGVRLTRPGILADVFPAPFANEEAARASNGGKLPPDLSLIVKAREGGAAYVYSILTGFHEQKPADFTVPDGIYYNPYFEGWAIGMPNTALGANAVTFSDGTNASIEQEAHDVATFLAWASDTKMEQRKSMGLAVLIFLVVLSGILFGAYRKIWKDAH